MDAALAQIETDWETISDKYLEHATTPPSAHDYLVDGDNFINTVNVGNNTATVFALYAREATRKR